MAQDKESVPDPDHVGTAALIWLLLAGVIGLLLYLTYVFSGKGKKKKTKDATAAENTAPALRQAATVAGGARRRQRMRVRNRDASDSDDDFNTNRFDDDDMVDGPLDGDQVDGKIGAKKAKKLEMKAERKAQREAELEEREEKKRRDAMLESERKKEDARRKLEADQRAEQERLRKEEEERKEYEEYLQIKASFVVEESGEVGIITEEESQSLLQEFIDYIKNTKVVLLEDLGARFNLKTQEAIDRLELLLEEGRITGVMDDRGKFIYISEEELQNVAKFIKQRGRISIADLAESSNSLVNMEGSKKEQVCC